MMKPTTTRITTPEMMPASMYTTTTHGEYRYYRIKFWCKQQADIFFADAHTNTLPDRSLRFILWQFVCNSKTITKTYSPSRKHSRAFWQEKTYLLTKFETARTCGCWTARRICIGNSWVCIINSFICIMGLGGIDRFFIFVSMGFNEKGNNTNDQFVCNFHLSFFLSKLLMTTATTWQYPALRLQS